MTVPGSSSYLFHAPRTELRASGSLVLLPPLHLLEAVERSGQSCRLTMRDPSGGNVLIVVFHEGRPTMVFSPGDGRSVGELLLDAGLLDRASLTQLLRTRVREGGSLERLLRERTSITDEELQKYFDFQARARLLEALAWRAGSFELERFFGDDEMQFRLQLPCFSSLAMRAQARAETLTALGPELPCAPEHLLVRRRAGAAKVDNGVKAAVLRELTEPRLLTQLVARTLYDDDLVLRAVVELAGSRTVVIQPRVTAVPTVPPGQNDDESFAGELLKGVVGRLRGAGRATDPALWVLVVGGEPGQAQDLVAQLGGTAVSERLGGVPAVTTVARARVRVGRGAMLSVVAMEPEALSRSASDPLISRFDVVCVVRKEQERAPLEVLLDRFAPTGGPLVVGINLGRFAHNWPNPVRAVLTIPQLDAFPRGGLALRLIELMHGAASQA